MPDVFATGLFDVVLGLFRVEIAVKHQQLVRLGVARSYGMGFQVAEMRGEVLLLDRRDVLVAKEQHLVFQPQRPYFGDDVGIQRGISQADVAEFGADRGRAKPTLIECRRADGRTMAGADGVACEGVSWVPALLSSMLQSVQCGGEQYARPG